MNTRFAALGAPLGLLVLVACGDKDDDSAGSGGGGSGDDTAAQVVDADGDGFAEEDDCDDSDADVNPDAVEVCDGVDNDCDAAVDDEDPTLSGAPTWYLDHDGDGDGDGDPIYAVEACTQPDGFVDNAADCDDLDPSAWTGGTEVCDGVYNDCDGAVDGADTTDAVTWYVDADGDGFGDDASATTDCAPPSDAVEVAGDCDDAAAQVNPGAAEICSSGIDEDCDGAAIPCAMELADAGVTLQGAAGEDAAWLGESRFDYAAGFVAKAGDVDGDTYADLLVGVVNDDDGAANAGAVVLLRGGAGVGGGGVTSLASAHAKLLGSGVSDKIGGAIAGAVDVDGDGFDDVAVGGRLTDPSTGSDAGTLYVVTGPVTGASSLSDAPVRVWGDGPSNRLGEVVAGAGDVDSDGYDDLLVSAPLEASSGIASGAVYVVPGSGDLAPLDGVAVSSVAATVFQGSEADMLLGGAIAGGADLDGDGALDMVVGADAWDGVAQGIALVFRGPWPSGTVSAADADASLHGEATTDQAGGSLSFAGDHAGGAATLVVGAPGHDGLGTDGGAVYLLDGLGF